MTQREPDEEQPVVELATEDCWELLADEEVGRLAYRLVDEVHIVPINYAVDGRTILFRTAPGNKLLAAALGSEVAFEVDWYGGDAAWSVVVRGRLRRLGEDEQHRLNDARLYSWLPTPKYEGVELTPAAVSGRRFRLRRSADGESAGT
jgi:uncharacterized protein